MGVRDLGDTCEGVSRSHTRPVACAGRVTHGGLLQWTAMICCWAMLVCVVSSSADIF